jgi:hypothetical protein
LRSPSRQKEVIWLLYLADGYPYRMSCSGGIGIFPPLSRSLVLAFPLFPFLYSTLIPLYSLHLNNLWPKQPKNPELVVPGPTAAIPSSPMASARQRSWDTSRTADGSRRRGRTLPLFSKTPPGLPRHRLRFKTITAPYVHHYGVNDSFLTS